MKIENEKFVPEDALDQEAIEYAKNHTLYDRRDEKLVIAAYIVGYSNGKIATVNKISEALLSPK